jgi:hypothetical protein
MPLLQALGVGDEQVVAHQLDLVTDGVGEDLPAFPVVLVQRVLDGDQRVVGNEFGVVGAHLGGAQGLALELVGTVLEELGGGDVQGQGDVLARGVAGVLDGFLDQVQGSTVGRQVRGEAALVAEAGGEALLLEHGLEVVVNLDAPAQASEKVSAPIGAIMNSWMSTSESACEPPLRMFISGTGRTWAFGPPRYLYSGRSAEALRRWQRPGRRRGWRWRPACPCWRAVQVDHGLVDAALVGGVEAGQGRCDLVDDGVNGLLDTLAEVAALVAVAQFNGFVLAGGSTGRRCGAAYRAGCQSHLGLHGRIATGVDDFQSGDLRDFRHASCAFGQWGRSQDCSGRGRRQTKSTVSRLQATNGPYGPTAELFQPLDRVGFTKGGLGVSPLM